MSQISTQNEEYCIKYFPPQVPQWRRRNLSREEGHRGRPSGKEQYKWDLRHWATTPTLTDVHNWYRFLDNKEIGIGMGFLESFNVNRDCEFSRAPRRGFTHPFDRTVGAQVVKCLHLHEGGEDGMALIFWLGIINTLLIPRLSPCSTRCRDLWRYDPTSTGCDRRREHRRFPQEVQLLGKSE